MLCITFDNFGRAAGDLLPWACPADVPPIEWAAYNRIGLELGHPRILQLLESLKIRCTYFAEGYAAVLHPDEMRAWHAAGHEIAIHGWKHEIWSSVASREEESRLVELAVKSICDLTGKAPVGFRPPGLAINPWTDDVLTAHGIRYVSQALPVVDAMSDAGARDDGAKAIVVTRLDVLPTDPMLIDGAVIHPRFGGIFGALDAAAAYDKLHQLAVAHETTRPDEPWVLVVHPFTSGNRAWFGFEDFMRRLVGEFGASSFGLAKDLASTTMRASTGIR
ncbi:TPA: polysaccharide deacetylase family protein [Burkholderia stabilis]|nr:polysaccharide deacetylase family protein [Burkholderia stabilis]HDR9649735.1 polysaccharide deacetylase family protein [Burkholderia stabilis]HDR9655476.1 polysaccharide deacetylase family protein [Burkholderia stabilis]HDR9679801.1 polysaccharide deacetylase family protein [Burkholderia stabilis]